MVTKKYAKDMVALRTGFDRRTGVERRVSHDLDYFDKGGKERRKPIDQRRSRQEFRQGWVRYTDYSSVWLSEAPEDGLLIIEDSE